MKSGDRVGFDLTVGAALAVAAWEAQSMAVIELKQYIKAERQR